jgi:acetyl-CoA C-acetyltransferase
MPDAFIFDAVRTPRGKGKNNGSLHEVRPVELLATLYRAIQERNQLDTSQVEDSIMGCVTPVGEQGSDIAKTAATYAGWSERVSGVTLNRFCASGLEACNMAAMKIQSGAEDLVVAGGVESMSRVPMGSDGGAFYADPRVNDAMAFIPQGISADLKATLVGITRHELDTYAATSQKRAAHARANGYFDKSLVPVKDMNGLTILDHDELIRGDTTPETLATLKPAFEQMGAFGFDATAMRRYVQVENIHHVHHAGNSSGIVDGASMLLIGSEAKGKELDLTPRARFRAVAIVCTEPTIMLEGPKPATEKALKKAGLNINDIDLFEINEAFAVVPLNYQRQLELDPEKVNVNGGAIALGHPLGATGAMLLGTLLDELERRDETLALCTLCAGGGMGIATVIERI